MRRAIEGAGGVSFRRMADALIVYGCSRSMNCATLAQLSSTHEICKAAGTYPHTAADHRADSVNLITTSTHPHDVSIERVKMNWVSKTLRQMARGVRKLLIYKLRQFYVMQVGV